MRIHYAQCWEDPRTLSGALEVTPQDDVVSIASGGDNCFALLLNNPHSLTAVDMNPAQIHLVELKMRAIQMLDYDDFIGFTGARPCRDRIRLYSYLRLRLSQKAREYWDGQTENLLKGIIHCGKFEQYFSIFRRMVLPLIHNKKTAQQLFSALSFEEQRNFYGKVWNNRRWRWLFHLFFGKLLLGHLGRCPSYFRYVIVENVADEIIKRTSKGLTEVPIKDNFFIEYILTGRYQNLEMAHPYLRKSNFRFLQEHVGEIRLFCGSLDEYLGGLEEASISKFNLSDIFEYMSEAAQEKTIQEILRVSRDDAKLVFWTLLVQRDLPLSLTDQIDSDRVVSDKLFSTDRTFFYGSFNRWRIHRKPQSTKSVSQIYAHSLPIG
jgi:S-adenosylmethionine-diacylglycerol 3-amino-3-carboxypropyl transferase